MGFFDNLFNWQAQTASNAIEEASFWVKATIVVVGLVAVALIVDDIEDMMT